MKTLFPFLTITILSIASYSQNYLSLGDQSATEFSWSFAKGLNNNSWQNHVQMGYTHAGKLEISLAYQANGGYSGDIIRQDRHFFFTRVSHAVQKEGVDPGKISLAAIGEFMLGGTSYENVRYLSGGIGIYKRIDQGGRNSIHPWVELLYDQEFGRFVGGIGYARVQLGADFIFGGFKLSPKLIAGRNGLQVGMGIGALIQSKRR